MTKKVLLIRVYHKNALTVFPPLGIGSLVEYVKERSTEFDFDLFDYCLDNNLDEFIKTKYSGIKPILIGISTLLRHFYLAIEIAKRLKQILPGVPIVMGGAGPSSLMDMVLENDSVDYVIYKDGEIGFLKLLEYVSRGGSPSDVPSLIFRSKDEIRINEPQVVHEEEIQIPDFDFLRLPEYFKRFSHVMLGPRKTYYAITTRGCPYSCIYCHHLFGRKVRFIPIEKILSSFEKFQRKYNFEWIDFSDDIFNIDEERAMKIISGIRRINRDIKFSYPNGFRVDIMSEKFMDFIGCNNTRFLSVAIETASQRLQNLLKKNINLEKAENNIRYLSRYNIPIITTFLFGLPTETLNELIKSIRFAFGLPITYASFLRVVPHIGSELFEILSDEQKRIIMTSLKSDLHYHNIDVNLSNIPDSILNVLQRFTGPVYYLRPRQIYRILRDTPARGLLQGGKLISQIALGRARE